jgi:hypothetical protein
LVHVTASGVVVHQPNIVFDVVFCRVLRYVAIAVVVSNFILYVVVAGGLGYRIILVSLVDVIVVVCFQGSNFMVTVSVFVFVGVAEESGYLLVIYSAGNVSSGSFFGVT